MSPDGSDDQKKISLDKAAVLLFNDSSKNVSDLKARQWTAANFGVLAIMAIAVFDHKETIHHEIVVTVLMFFIWLCHLWVTYKCHRNLDIFRTRIKNLVSCYFIEESHELFEKGEPNWQRAKKLRFPRGKEGQDFEDAVADEGSIELGLFLTTTVTLIFACFVVWCWH